MSNFKIIKNGTGLNRTGIGKGVYDSVYPNLFVDKKEREEESYIVSLNNYFTSIALRQYEENLKTFAKNYVFLKGDLTQEDFYEDLEPDAKAFMSDITKNQGLPKYIQNYSIMNQPINTIKGELSRRPDTHFIRAFDEYSQSERFKSIQSTLMSFFVQKIQDEKLMEFQNQGLDINDEQVFQEFERQTEEELSEKIDDVTLMVEKWANRMLENMKMQFNTKMLGEDGFDDLIKTGRIRYHIYEDGSDLGFNVENVNPKNVFVLKHKDKKFLKDAYVAGIIDTYEIGELIQRFKLTKDEVDALMVTQHGPNWNSKKRKASGAGINSISYDTRTDPFYEYSEMLVDADMEVRQEFEVYMGLRSSTTFGDKFLAVQTYVKGKLRIGKLTYLDEEGIPQVMPVDENYKKGMHPGEMDLEWYYVDQWFKAINIANTLYSYEPVEFIDTLPLIGGDFEPRNSKVKGFVDLMKPYQVLYNVIVNQIFRLLEKEIGVVYNVVLKKIPVLRDGDHEDAIDVWEAEARERGVVFEDDSVENMGTPGNNTNNSRPIDLTRSREIQNRWELAERVKLMCWELAGFNRERLGAVAASQTAYGTQAAMSNSYSQTEPWFTFHGYVMNDLYQSILDACQYYESGRNSTISFISDDGSTTLMDLVGSDFSLVDLRVFMTNRTEDYETLSNLRNLSQAMMQNGMSAYDISLINTSKSIRFIQGELKKLKETAEQRAQMAQQIEQDKVSAIREQTKADSDKFMFMVSNDNMNKKLDRESKERIAAITTFNRQDDNLKDSNANGVPDVYDLMSLDQEARRIEQESDIDKEKNRIMTSNNTSAMVQSYQRDLTQLKLKKIDAEEKEKDRELRRDEMKSQEFIAVKNKN